MRAEVIQFQICIISMELEAHHSVFFTGSNKQCSHNGPEARLFPRLLAVSRGCPQNSLLPVCVG